MAAPNCLRCLLRPSSAMAIPRRLAPVTIATAPFSSSAPTLYASKPASSSMSKHIRAGKKMKLGKFKKKKNIDRGKPPAPGERKAFRKRILLSNNNALSVPGLGELSADAMLDPTKTGRVLAIPNELVDQLRAVEAFKPSQCWGLFRQPSILVRAETTDLAKRMQDSARKQETLRLVITGEKLAGKSTLLLQSMAYGYLNGWIVFNIPEGESLLGSLSLLEPGV